MPVKRGHVAPQNTFIDTLIQKFDSQRRKFLIANAVLPHTPIIFCSDDLCTMCGFSRSQILQRSAALEFMYGPLTSSKSTGELKHALTDCEEKLILAILYNKSGLHFVCQIAVVPVRNADCQVRLYILTFRSGSDFENAADSRGPSDRVAILSWASHLQRFWGLSRIFATMGSGTPQPDASLSVSLSRERDPQDLHTKYPVVDTDHSSEASPKTPPRRHSASEISITEMTTNRTQTMDAQLPTSSLQNLHDTDISFPEFLRGVRQTRRMRFLPSKIRALFTGTSPTRHDNSSVAHGLGGILISTDSGACGRRNVSDKVAEMLSLGPDVNPEQKFHAPRIHPFTLKHYGPVKAVWDWLVLVLVIYTAIFTPYAATFLLPEANRQKRQDTFLPMQHIDLFVDVMFIIDILINFRTTYVNKNDELVSHPGRIAIHYFKGWFLIDVVAAVPFDLLQFGAQTDEMVTLIGLLKTARLLRLVRVVRKLDRYSEYGAAVLLLLMATFILIAHWLACIWYAVGHIERHQYHVRIGWLDHLAFQTRQPYHNYSSSSAPLAIRGPTTQSKYITALYFTFSSLTSVGFGNVSPNTNPEKIFSICVMLIGSLMYAGIFGHVSAIIQRLYSGTARYHTQMLRVKEFIRFNQIPNPLKRRLEEFFQHAWSYTNGIDMNLVLRSFPECLQADICLHLNQNLLETSPPFIGASQGCLRSLALKLKTTHVPPGDTLVHKGDILCFICFIARGSIEILSGNDIVAVLCQGDVFGESPFGATLMAQSKFYVRALTYCDLHKIHHDDLFEIMEMYPEFSKRFRSKLEITFDLQKTFSPGVNDSSTLSSTNGKQLVVPQLDARDKSEPIHGPHLSAHLKDPMCSSVPFMDAMDFDSTDPYHEPFTVFQNFRPTHSLRNSSSPSRNQLQTNNALRLKPSNIITVHKSSTRDSTSGQPDKLHVPTSSTSTKYTTCPSQTLWATAVTSLAQEPKESIHEARAHERRCNIKTTPAHSISALLPSLTARFDEMERQLFEVERRFDTDVSRILSLIQQLGPPRPIAVPAKTS